MFEAKNPSYHGPERRAIERRTDADRRESIRFEVNSLDRRQQHSRREEDSTKDPWNIGF